MTTCAYKPFRMNCARRFLQVSSQRNFFGAALRWRGATSQHFRRAPTARHFALASVALPRRASALSAHNASVPSDANRRFAAAIRPAATGVAPRHGSATLQSLQGNYRVKYSTAANANAGAAAASAGNGGSNSSSDSKTSGSEQRKVATPAVGYWYTMH